MTPSQRRMLENARDGRELGHGFPRGRYGLGRSASSVCASLYDLGLITHSLSSEGPATVLTLAGERALLDAAAGALPPQGAQR